MPRYIDADAVKKFVFETGFYCDTDEDKQYTAEIIDSFPTADVVERKRGKWIWLSSTYDRVPCEMRYMCSECHHETIIHSNEMSTPWEKFCPNCGADMRKETEDADNSQIQERF